MAQNAQININVNTQGAEKTTKNLGKSIGEVTKETIKATERLAKMEDALFNLEPGTKQFRALAKEAGALQDQIDKARSEIRTFANDMFALEGTLGTIQGITSAYTGASAAMALFGSESEELIEVFARLELIQKVVNGLTATYASFQRGSAAATFLSTVATRAHTAAKTISNAIDQTALRLTTGMTTATVAQTTATSAATFATRALSVAMKAIPLLAVISGVVALGSALFSSSKDTEEANKRLEEYQETQKKLIEEKAEFRGEVAKESGEFVNLIGQLKLTNAGSQERLDIIKELNENYGQTLQDIGDETAFLNDVNVALDEYIRLQTNKAKLDKNQKDLNDLIAEEIRLNEEIKEDYDEIAALAEKKGISFGEASRNISLTDKTYRRNLQTLEDVRTKMAELITSSFNLRNENNDLTKSYREQQEELKKQSEAEKKAEEARRNAARRRAEQQRTEQAALKETIRVSEIALRQSSVDREDRINEIINSNFFEKTFFGEADPGGRLKAIYSQLSDEVKAGITDIDKSLSPAEREKSIWNNLFNIEEFRQIYEQSGSIIDQIDQEQDRIGRAFNQTSQIIDEEYKDQLNFLRIKIQLEKGLTDEQLESDVDYVDQRTKLERDKNAKLEKAQADLAGLNKRFNDLRNQATRRQYDTEIRELELQLKRQNLTTEEGIKESQRIQREIERKQLQNKFDEELKATAELFGRNSEEYKKLVIQQNAELIELDKELTDRFEKEDQERLDNKVSAMANALSNVRQLTQTTSFVISEAVNGSFESMRNGFNALRDQLMNPETGILGIMKSLKDGTLSTTQAILAGFEIALDALNAVFERVSQENLERNQMMFEANSEALKSELANRQITQEQFDDRMKDLEDQKRVKEISEKRKQFNREKTNNLALAAINTAQSVLQALGSSPPPASYIMAAISAALGAVQIAAISSQQFKAARGGIVPGRGASNRDTVPAMLAPGEAVINANSARMFPVLLSRINQLGGGISLAPEPDNLSNATPKENNDPLRAYVVWNDFKEKRDFDERDRSMNTFS